MSPPLSENYTAGIKERQIWQALDNPDYRRAYIADVGTGLAFQIRSLRESRGWTQEELAARTGKRQETISQWENPDYGRYSLTTLIELAIAFDVGLVTRFAPLSELVEWSVHLDSRRLAPPSFSQEREVGRSAGARSAALEATATALASSAQLAAEWPAGVYSSALRAPPLATPEPIVEDKYAVAA